MVSSFKLSLAIHFSLLNTRSLRNKASLVLEYIVDNKVDNMALTGTWLSSGNRGKRLHRKVMYLNMSLESPVV